jgi:hypothetical protein
MSELRRVLTELGWDQHLIDAVENAPTLAGPPSPPMSWTAASYTDVTEIVYPGKRESTFANPTYRVGPR